MFKAECGANISYMMNMEPLPIGEGLKERIENAKVDAAAIP